MAESPEHAFLETEFLQVLKNFSATSIYGYTEADRKKYDLSCILQRDWDRPLIGQALWSHEKGLDKDLRMLITSDSADIWTYILKDSIKNKAALFEVINDFKKSRYCNDLYKLKIFWIPPDFDADSEKQQKLIGDILKNAIVDDLLFNVVFGRLTADDFNYFIQGFSGLYGLQIAILSHIAVNGLWNYQRVHEALDVSKGPIREKIGQLQAKGFITGTGMGSYISLKGRVLLSIIKKTIEEYQTGNFSPELSFLLTKLEQPLSPTFSEDLSRMNNLDILLRDYNSALSYTGFTLDESKFKINGDF
jgi:hypothetical protein